MHRTIIAVLLLSTACHTNGGVSTEVSSGPERLSSRPQANVTTAPAGTYSLSVSSGFNCCILQIPNTTSTGKLPLLVMLHGAGGTPGAIDQMFALGEEFDFAVLAPKSTKASWDVIYGGFGVDVARIDGALTETFKRLNVDAQRIALAGFSDGASYGLGLGMANGDLFTHVIAFSPGFMPPVERVGKPLFFVAHGRSDGILPFEATADRFVPFLRTLGYTVRFDEFAGGHTVDNTEARMAIQWFKGTGE